MKKEPGLSFPIARRIFRLRRTLTWADTKVAEAQYHLTRTLHNIITAYRTGELDWCHGFVTYWNNGVQLCPPRPFRWEEYRYLYDTYDGNRTGFWIEGVSDYLQAILRETLG
jgi:hypothetical protein